MDKNQKALRDLQQTLTDYAAITKKAPEKIIVEKGKQLLFGSHNKYANFKGLYDEFSAVKPHSGEILASAKSVLSAGGGIKTSAKSRKLAADILGGNSAGVFVGGVPYYCRGNLLFPFLVNIIRSKSNKAFG